VAVLFDCVTDPSISEARMVQEVKLPAVGACFVSTLCAAAGLGNLRAHHFGNIEYLGFSRAVNYTYLVMAKSAPKPKSAMDTLVDSFSDLVADAKKRMSPEEFRRAEKEFDEIVDKAKARASRGGHRETA
jgi:hypothetical protein